MWVRNSMVKRHGHRMRIAVWGILRNLGCEKTEGKTLLESQLSSHARGF